MRRIQLPQMDPDEVADQIGEFVVDVVSSVGSTGCVIGLSGGVDSTTSAAIIKRGFDKHNREHGTNLELIGYMLPSSTNSRADTLDGENVAKRLGIRYEICNIEEIIRTYGYTNPEALADKYHRGNLSSRVRANVLSTKAAVEYKTLAGTGNRDEDYGIGYYTLFGDGAVHVSPIGNLPKRLVREMAAHLGFEDLSHREPTAGLEPGQTDFKDLGYRYNLVELVVEGFDQGFTKEELPRHEQILPLFEEQQAAYAQMYGDEKFSSAREMIDDIERRHKIAAAKVQIVSPPVAPVRLEYV